MRHDSLDPDIGAAIACTQSNPHRFVATGVYGVDVRAGQVGEGEDMVHALGLYDRRAGNIMVLRPRLPLRQQRLLHRVDRLGVLTMGCDDSSQLPGQLERAKQVLVGKIEGTLVRQEHLERRNPFLGNDGFELLLRFLVETNHRHVKGVVDSGQ